MPTKRTTAKTIRSFDKPNAALPLAILSILDKLKSKDRVLPDVFTERLSILFLLELVYPGGGKTHSYNVYHLGMRVDQHRIVHLYLRPSFPQTFHQQSQILL
jgi:hypothetical protein